MVNSSKEDKIKKEIVRYVIVMGIFIFIAIKLLGVDLFSSLNNRLISKDEDARENAVTKLKSLDSSNKDKHIDFLIKVLSDQNNPSRYLAAHTLSQIGPLARKAIPELVEALKSDNYDVRWNVLYTLANLGPIANKTAPDLYPSLLKAENKYERVTAAIALVSMGETRDHLNDIIAQLIASLNYNDMFTRKKAINALGNLGSIAKESVPALLTSAQSTDKELRICALWALGRMNEKNQSVYDTLTQALQDKNNNVRLNALISLDTLYPETKEKIPDVKNAIEKEKLEKSFDSALLYSGFDGDSVNAQELINLGANVNVKGYQTGKTTLMIAAQEGRIEVVKVLLKNGGDVNIVSDGKGVDPDVNEPFLPINMFSIFKYLFSSGNKSNQGTGNYEGKTALMYAVESEISDEEKMQIIKLLIDQGADKNIVEKDRRTALMIAENLKNKIVVEFLKSQNHE